VKTTSKRLVTTRYSRGTDGYRAPEVIPRPEDGHYNKRADDFALGDVMFEALTGQKLFESDWHIGNYAGLTQTDVDSDTLSRQIHSRGVDANSLIPFRKLIMKLLAVQPKNRPTACDIREQLLSIRLCVFYSTKLSEEEVELSWGQCGPQRFITEADASDSGISLQQPPSDLLMEEHSEPPGQCNPQGFITEADTSDSAISLQQPPSD
jgi:serine/threonine protein kinase